MFTTVDDILHLSPAKIGVLVKNVVETARAVNLVYVRDAEPGIKRLRKGKTFQYIFNAKKISEQAELERIRKLVIPPAWENVWICTRNNGHLQATGIDLRNRKQYRYHPLWNSLRNHTKFYRLREFGAALPQIRRNIEQDLSLPGLPPEKILALVLSLMEQTNIRVGNGQYERLYGSYGLTTLKDRHVAFSGDKMQFTFKGKKGIRHSISIRNRRLAKLVKQCRDIPGKELFQYYEEKGKHHAVDSGMVNDYIRKISGSDFTAKDFRTWSGTIHALQALRSLGCCDTKALAKKKIVEALDIVSQHLGNTRTVCRKYYVHPLILTLYESNALEKYFVPKGKAPAKDKHGLQDEERILMKILEEELQTQKQRS